MYSYERRHGALFSCDSVLEDGRAVICLIGDLDMASAPDLSECLAHLERHGATTMVLDLAALEFCDSSGLRELLVLHKPADEIGTRMVLRSPTAALRRLLELTRTSDLLEIEGSTTG